MHVGCNKCAPWVYYSTEILVPGLSPPSARSAAHPPDGGELTGLTPLSVEQSPAVHLVLTPAAARLCNVEVTLMCHGDAFKGICTFYFIRL